MKPHHQPHQQKGTRPPARPRQLGTTLLTERGSVFYIIPLAFVSWFRIADKLDYFACSTLIEGFLNYIWQLSTNLAIPCFHANLI